MDSDGQDTDEGVELSPISGKSNAVHQEKSS